MKYPQGHRFFVWVSGEDAAYLHQWVEQQNTARGLEHTRDAATVQGVMGAIVSQWVYDNRREAQEDTTCTP